VKRPRPGSLSYEEAHAGQFVDEYDHGGSRGPQQGPETALGNFLRGQPQVIFGQRVQVGLGVPPAGAGAFYDARRLLQVSLPPELAGSWTLTLHTPQFVTYPIFGAGTLIDPGAPNVLDSFLRVRWGMGDGQSQLEADALVGQQLALAGSYFEVDYIARDPFIAGLGTRQPYFVAASLAPSVAAVRSLIRRTVTVGNIAFGAASLQFSVPRYAAEFLTTIGAATTQNNIIRTIVFLADNGATEVARFEFLNVAGRTTFDVSAWAPIPARAQTFQWLNGGAAATQTFASVIFRLGL